MMLTRVVLLLMVIALDSHFATAQDYPSQARQRATFQQEERAQILADGYACNKPNKTDEQQDECERRVQSARARISEKIRQNHQAVEGSVEQIRQLNQQPQQSEF